MEVSFDGSNAQWETLLLLALVSLASSIIVQAIPTLGRRRRAIDSIEFYERLSSAIADPDEHESKVIEAARARAVTNSAKAIRDTPKPSRETVNELLWIAYIYGTNLLIMFFVSKSSNKVMAMIFGEVIWILLILASAFYRRRVSDKRKYLDVKRIEHHGAEAIQEDSNDEPSR